MGSKIKGSASSSCLLGRGNLSVETKYNDSDTRSTAMYSVRVSSSNGLVDKMMEYVRDYAKRSSIAMPHMETRYISELDNVKTMELLLKLETSDRNSTEEIGRQMEDIGKAVEKEYFSPSAQMELPLAMLRC